MAEGIQGLERLMNRVKRLHDRTSKEIERPMKGSGVLMLASIEKNFKASGRPKGWEKLADSTVARRRKGKGRGGIKILVDTAKMKNSMAMRVRRDEVAVGTNAVQAKRQHFGYPKGEGRGHSKTPARPFVMFQDPEDFDTIGKLFSRHIRS